MLCLLFRKYLHHAKLMSRRVFALIVVVVVVAVAVGGVQVAVLAPVWGVLLVAKETVLVVAKQYVQKDVQEPVDMSNK